MGQYPDDEDEHPFWIFKIIKKNQAQFFERVSVKEESKEKIRWYFGVGPRKPPAITTLPLDDINVIGPVVMALDEEVRR
jgi:hypothetical protein